MRFVFDTMGTTVSVATPSPLPEPLRSRVHGVFVEYDERFSLYRPGSEGAGLATGQVDLAEASVELRQAHDLAWHWSRLTAGAFTPRRPDGRIDLSGVVKALAMQSAGQVLLDAGRSDWCVNAGGDVLVSGTSETGRPWGVGIVDPDDRRALLTRFTCTPSMPAVATSGTSERGEHIWRQRPDPAALPGELRSAPFRQVTVAGPDIVTADVLATAVLAGGRRCLEHVLVTWPVEVIAATVDGQYLATTAFRQAPQADPGEAGATG